MAVEALPVVQRGGGAGKKRKDRQEATPQNPGSNAAVPLHLRSQVRVRPALGTLDARIDATMHRICETLH